MSASYYHPEWADGEEYHSSQEHAGQSDEDSFASANDEGIDEDDDDENDLDFENGDEDLDEDEEVDEEDEDDEDDDDEDGGHFHGRQFNPKKVIDMSLSLGFFLWILQTKMVTPYPSRLSLIQRLVTRSEEHQSA